MPITLSAAALYFGHARNAPFVDVLTALIVGGLDGAIDPPSRAVVDLARAVNATPTAATPAMAAALRQQRRDADKCIDVVLAAAIFGKANRLMHTLGHSSPQKRR